MPRRAHSDLPKRRRGRVGGVLATGFGSGADFGRGAWRQDHQRQRRAVFAVGQGAPVVGERGA